MTVLERWKQRARQLKQESYALYLAYKDPRVPWYARLFAACVVGYAFSPIDLIPDPIPVLGYLDDLVLAPLGIALAVKLLPPVVLAECHQQAREAPTQGKADQLGRRWSDRHQLTSPVRADYSRPAASAVVGAVLEHD